MSIQWKEIDYQATAGKILENNASIKRVELHRRWDQDKVLVTKGNVPFHSRDETKIGGPRLIMAFCTAVALGALVGVGIAFGLDYSAILHQYTFVQISAIFCVPTASLLFCAVVFPIGLIAYVRGKKWLNEELDQDKIIRELQKAIPMTQQVIEQSATLTEGKVMIAASKKELVGKFLEYIVCKKNESDRR